MAINQEARITLTAEDKASSVIDQASNKANSAVQASGKSVKEFGVASAGVVTAGLALANTMDAVQSANIRVDQTAKAVTTAQLALKKAQEGSVPSAEAIAKAEASYEAAIFKAEQENLAYEKAQIALTRAKEDGKLSADELRIKEQELALMLKQVNKAEKEVEETSDEVTRAQQGTKVSAEELALKQEAVSIAMQRADKAQSDLNTSMIQSAVSVIPTSITLFDNLNKMGLGKLTSGIGGAVPAIGGLKTAFSGLSLSLGPIGIALIAITAAIAIFTLAWSQNWFDIQGKTKVVIDALSGAFQHLVNLFTWIGGELGKLYAFWRSMWDAIGAVIKFVWDVTIAPIVNLILNAIKNVQAGIGVVSGIISGAGKALGIPGAQGGANIMSGGSILVGERGPEILQVPTGAKVSPLTGGGGLGGTVEVQITLDASFFEAAISRYNGRMTVITMGRVRYP